MELLDSYSLGALCAIIFAVTCLVIGELRNRRKD